jgi:hypothetical protein
VLDLRQKRRIAAGFVDWLRYDTVLAQDRAVWLDCNAPWGARRTLVVASKACSLHYLDLTVDDPKPMTIELGPAFEDFPQPVISPSGRELVQARGRRLMVFSLPSLRLRHEVVFETAQTILEIRPSGEVTTLAKGIESGSRISTVASDGSVRSVEIQGQVGNVGLGEGLLMESYQGECWLIDTEGRRLQQIPILIFRDSQVTRLAEGGFAWMPHDGKALYGADAEGGLFQPVALPAPDVEELGAEVVRRWAETYLGPEVDSGRVLVSSGAWGLKKVALAPWKFFDLRLVWATSGAGGPSWPSLHAQYDRVDQWRTFYVDLATAQVLATFEGFKVQAQGIESPDGTQQAWLLDEKGLPHRFDPRHPEATLEPVFEPPWQVEP